MNTHYQKYKDLVPIVPQSNENATITFPDGKTYKIPILKGTLGPPVLDIRNLAQQTGYFTYDPGFTATSSCASQITYIDGEKGQLLYRGYKIEDLAENCSFMETCYLMIYGQLPCKKEKEAFEELVVSEMVVHKKIQDFYQGFQADAHPMAIMLGVVGALSAFMYQEFNVNDSRDREHIAIKVIAKIPTLAAYAFRTASGLPLIQPKKKYNYVQNFLYMMLANPMDEEFQIDEVIVQAIDKILLLHADHEQNASSSTVRIAGSSQANPFACIAAGIASLWGPMHGGANEAVLNMLEQIGNVDNIEKILQMSKDKSSGFRLMGFGHRVYKNFDPRAKIMQKMCYKVLQAVGQDTMPLFDLALKLEQAALNDKYFLDRKLYPNVDFYTGLVYKAIDIPVNMFTVMFVIARSIGWITQWSEMMAEGLNKIGRPRQVYVGEKIREFVKIEDRKKQNQSNILQMPKLAKVTNLMKL
ncbi:hypothetical protein IMG5_193840 [Ichthyophthirius multifiliis]|uniref:Citrate synthase n=1 Tax=Ichthyophthirius multifiliis TaxID=5932 RepID=G0R4M4_ICHMU|nr:hypothetical protein IMG5_193840 [Ichthyophthirius multifiliis]EGR27584.1 hypothetical protein IMG5_193840 [Ichthyophthirius multifiliis]|eukprot:XP_004025036.1 hypothetical protein IMG5_193840 [Ichthyophthirius multifiliis]